MTAEYLCIATIVISVIALLISLITFLSIRR